MNRLILKYFLPSLAFLLLIIILLNNRTPFGKRNTSFSADPKKEITRIEFSCDDKKLILEKKGNEWRVNGQNEARKSSILFILKVLNEIRIKSPVSAELFNQEITEKEIMPIRVKVFEKNKIIRSFLVYKTNSNSYGNIMKIRHGSKPFIVSIPGFEEEIGSAFNIHELYWRPFIIFNILPSQISSVSVENYSDIPSSFSIVNSKLELKLAGTEGTLTGWDSSRIIRYLSYFVRIPFESWASELSPEERRKIESGQPLFLITVTESDGTERILTLWDRWLENNGKLEKDTDRLWAKTNNSNELLIMRYSDVDPILKKKSYFFTK